MPGSATLHGPAATGPKSSMKGHPLLQAHDQVKNENEHGINNAMLYYWV